MKNKSISLIVMDDDRFQPFGVAVYRNEFEVRAEIERSWANCYREEIDDETGEVKIISGEDFFSEIQSEFMALTRVEDFNPDLVPKKGQFHEYGFFHNHDEYEKAKISE